MSTQAQQKNHTTKTESGETAREVADGEKLLQEMLDKEVEFTPFQAKNPIKLSARLVKKFLCKPTKAGKICSTEQAIRFIMLCKSRGLDPWEGDAYIVGYDAKDGPEFSLITAIQALIKRSEVHPRYNGFQCGVIVQRGQDVLEMEGDFYLPDDVLLGGWAKVYQKDIQYPSYSRLALRNYNKGFGVWTTNAPRMIVKTSLANALRHAFPNSLGGMYLEDSLEDKVLEAVEDNEKNHAPLPIGRTNFRSPTITNGNSNGHSEPAKEEKEEPKQEQPAETKADEQPEPQTGSDLFGGKDKNEEPPQPTKTEPAKEAKAEGKGKKVERTAAQKLLHNRITSEKITSAQLAQAMIEVGLMGEQQADKDTPKIETLSDQHCENVQAALDEIQKKG